jgi:hypothetical protein
LKRSRPKFKYFSLPQNRLSVLCRELTGKFLLYSIHSTC